MDQKTIGLLFFGSSLFSIEALKVLRKQQRLKLMGVVCPPDKERGRGRKMQPNVMKAYCIEQSIRVFQPEKLKDLRPFLEEENPRLGCVVAYGKILPSWMFDKQQFFPDGIFNVHASLLPRHRGASPIQGALVSGDLETGLAIQKMVPQLDAGPVWLSVKTSIGIQDTFGTIEKKLLSLLPGIMEDFGKNFPPSKSALFSQKEEAVTYASKFTAEDWTFEVKAGGPSWLKLRAYIPRPGVWLTFEGSRLFKICDVTYIEEESETSSLLEVRGNGTLCLKCSDNHVVQIEQVQMPGKPKQNVRDWINGHLSLIQKLSEAKVLSKKEA